MCVWGVLCTREQECYIRHSISLSVYLSFQHGADALEFEWNLAHWLYQSTVTRAPVPETTIIDFISASSFCRAALSHRNWVLRGRKLQRENPAYTCWWVQAEMILGSNWRRFSGGRRCWWCLQGGNIWSACDLSSPMGQLLQESWTGPLIWNFICIFDLIQKCVFPSLRSTLPPRSVSPFFNPFNLTLIAELIMTIKMEIANRADLYPFLLRPGLITIFVTNTTKHSWQLQSP
jgi:hypothetical protein